MQVSCSKRQLFAFARMGADRVRDEFAVASADLSGGPKSNLCFFPILNHCISTND